MKENVLVQKVTLQLADGVPYNEGNRDTFNNFVVIVRSKP